MPKQETRKSPCPVRQEVLELIDKNLDELGSYESLVVWYRNWGGKLGWWLVLRTHCYETDYDCLGSLTEEEAFWLIRYHPYVGELFNKMQELLCERNKLTENWGDMENLKKMISTYKSLSKSKNCTLVVYEDENTQGFALGFDDENKNSYYDKPIFIRSISKEAALWILENDNEIGDYCRCIMSYKEKIIMSDGINDSYRDTKKYYESEVKNIPDDILEREYQKRKTKVLKEEVDKKYEAFLKVVKEYTRSSKDKYVVDKELDQYIRYPRTSVEAQCP